MYRVRLGKSYRRALKRLRLVNYAALRTLESVVEALARGEAIAPIYKDHALSGEYQSFRECHIKNDLLLVYQIKKQDLILLLIDLGSHQDVFRG